VSVVAGPELPTAHISVAETADMANRSELEPGFGLSTTFHKGAQVGVGELYELEGIGSLAASTVAALATVAVVAACSSVCVAASIVAMPAAMPRVGRTSKTARADRGRSILAMKR
jgi:hypothetical protein